MLSKPKYKRIINIPNKNMNILALANKIYFRTSTSNLKTNFSK